MKAVKMRVVDKVSAQDIKKHLEGLGYSCGGEGSEDANYYFAGKDGDDRVTYDYDEGYFEAHSNEEIFLPSEEAVQTVDKAVVSDGGSSSYYTFPITNKAGQTIVVETADVIRCMVGNDFDLANIIKACRRSYEASQGRGKFDTSIEYDMNKIKYFADEYRHWNS